MPKSASHPVEPGSNPDRTGINMETLSWIIRDLNDNTDLQAILGAPVARRLNVVADCNDLRIEDAEDVKLTPEQEARFLDILGQVIQSHGV